MRFISVLLLGTSLAALWGCQPRSTDVEPAGPALPAPEEPPAEPLPVYICHQVGGDISIDGRIEPNEWDGADEIGPFDLWNGERAAYETTARLLWDDENLYLAVTCDDPDINPGEMRDRDQNLWEENEVVELFADANGDGKCYLEFEINPANTVLDLLIPEPGSPGPLFGKKCWDAKGMQTAVVPIHTTTALEGHDFGWFVEMAIPLECFLDAPRVPPEEGDEWRINLYRVDTDGENVEFQAWSPTNTQKPNFHVPERFGILRFTGSGS